jgi:hypothetical protein
MLPRLYKRIIRPRTLEFTKIYTTWCEIIPWISSRSETKLDLATAAPEKCSRLELGRLKIQSCLRLARPFSNQVREITLTTTSLHCQNQIFLKGAKWTFFRTKTNTKSLEAFLENHYKAYRQQNAQTSWKTMVVLFLNSIMQQSKRKFKGM